MVRGRAPGPREPRRFLRNFRPPLLYIARGGLRLWTGEFNTRSGAMASAAKWRKRLGSDTWHRCTTCPNWPTGGYTESDTASSGEKCNTCLAKMRTAPASSFPLGKRSPPSQRSARIYTRASTTKLPLRRQWTPTSVVLHLHPSRDPARFHPLSDVRLNHSYVGSEGMTHRQSSF